MHRDGIINQARVLVVDDLLATGGTAEAAIRLVQMVGGNVIGCAFVVELDALKGRERLAPINCFSLIHYD
jgi:adenine phosphoribosyltransferase